MKRYLVIGLSIMLVILVAVFLIAPVFAQEPPAGEGPWQDMYQACRSGDWQQMRDAMGRIWGNGNVPQPDNFAPGQAGSCCGFASDATNTTY